MGWITHSDPKDKMGFIRSGGGADSLTDLQFAAGLAANQSFYAGALVSYNGSRKIQAGLAAATSMPMMAVNGCADLDAGQYNYNLLKDVDGQGYGVVNCLPFSGGYELQTTEYNDTDHNIATAYTPGSQLLTNDTVTLGYIKPAPADYNSVYVLGTVSVGVITERKGINRARLRMGQKKLLCFWTMALPPRSTEASA
jgi:hypothetical protein